MAKSGKVELVYHLFGNGWDEWLDAEAEAIECFESAKKAGLGNLRIYTAEVNEDEFVKEEYYMGTDDDFPF